MDELNVVTGDICLENVRFSYQEDREILKGVSMNFTAGSFTSLVGKSL